MSADGSIEKWLSFPHEPHVVFPNLTRMDVETLVSFHQDAAEHYRAALVELDRLAATVPRYDVYRERVVRRKGSGLQLVVQLQERDSP